MSISADTIARNLQRVREQIATAARKSGRNPHEITLIAVTKYVDAETTRLVVEAGCMVIGESRPQALWAKSEALADFQRNSGFQWHLVGHLQRNKVARTLPVVRLLHSVDSERLLAEIDKTAATIAQRASVLLQVNISGDASKHGWRPADMPRVLDELDRYQHVDVRGLMAMAGLATDTDAARRQFASMSKLRDDLFARGPDNVQLNELSMGMSRDFAVAIEEGATMVRIGSTLFQESLGPNHD